MSATPVEMAEAQDFPKSAFVVLLEDYRALERQLAEAKGTQIGWMVEGTYNGEEISRTLFALEDREFADLFKENNGGVVKPIYDAPTQMKRSLEPQASAEDRVMAPILKGNDMDDLTATRLCAEAMDYELETITKDGPLHYRIKGICTYDPLHDDAQAMALVKRFMLHIDAFAGMAEFPHGELYPTYDDDSLNRAVVYCVAKMQAAKVAALSDGGHK